MFLPYQAFLSIKIASHVWCSFQLIVADGVLNPWPDRWKTFSFSCKMFCRTGSLLLDGLGILWRFQMCCGFLEDPVITRCCRWKFDSVSQFWIVPDIYPLVSKLFCLHTCLIDMNIYILTLPYLTIYLYAVFCLIHHDFGHDCRCSCWGFSRGGCCELWSNLERLGQTETWCSWCALIERNAADVLEHGMDWSVDQWLTVSNDSSSAGDSWKHVLMEQRVRCGMSSAAKATINAVAWRMCATDWVWRSWPSFGGRPPVLFWK